MNRLSLSVLKSNKLFSCSLFLIYMIITVILVLLTFFYPSVNASVDAFLKEYGMADAEILTTGAPREAGKALEQLDGIAKVDAVLTTEEKVALVGRDVFTLRFSSIPADSFCKFYNSVLGNDVELDDDSVLISEQFAKRNHIAPGDELLILRSEQQISLTVTDVVTCPETIFVARDVNSWFDSTQYAFVYVSETIMNDVLRLSPVANVFRIWLADGTDEAAALNSAQDILGGAVLTSTLKEDSTVYYQIHSTMDALKAVIIYMPVLIFLMGLLFCSFFVYQIIFSSRNMIATLQALGMGTRRICGIFIRYNLILCTAALLFGGAVGFPVLRFLLSFYEDVLGLADVVIKGDIYVLPLVVLAVYIIGILSCVICAGSISGSDPATIFAGTSTGMTTQTPAFLGKLRMNAYAKISLASILRNKKRLAVMCLCNIACLILTFISFSVLMSKLTGMDFMFRERMDYDFIVLTDSEDCMRRVAALPEAAECEYTAAAVFTYEDEYMRLEVLEHTPTLTVICSPDGTSLSVPEDGIILEEGFARRHGLGIGDTLSLNGLSLTVTDICRQYFCSAQYISPETAARLGVYFPNALWVRLANPLRNADNFRKQISKMDEVSCFYSISERQKSAVESMRTIDVPCYLFAAFGILIGAIIISNINILSIQQRKKEFATLTVLGSSGKQFASLFLMDMGIQYCITLVLGLTPARLISKWILRNMSSMSLEFASVRIWTVTFAAAGAVLLYLLLSLISAKKTIDRLNLVEILAKR